MINEPFIYLIALLFALDLLLVVIRSCLLNARLPQLLDQRGTEAESMERTLQLSQKLSLRVSLRVALAVVHLLLAVTIWLLLVDRVPAITVGWGLLVVVGAALLIEGFEFAAEGAALKDPEAWALRLTPLAGVLDILLRPISALYIALLGSSAELERRGGLMTENELKSWVEEENDEGSLEKEERQMIYSIFHFGDTVAREIMVPRIDILALEASTRVGEAIRALSGSGHSRVPVYEETIDNVIGLLYAKDLLRVRFDEGEEASVRPLLRPAYFVPDAKKVDELLREMQSRRVHMAVVVDEYGGMAGLVTLEDIMEEIVGEIRDEYDQGEELPYQQIGPGEYLFHGRIAIEDVNDALDIHLSDEEADTLGGYLYSMIGRVPAGGEEVNVEGWTLRIEQVSARRIRKVRAVRSEGISLETPQEKSNDKR